MMNKEFLDLTDCGGEMGKLIREVDWSQSAVGPFSHWPQSLKTALSICLASKFPMFVWWGKELTVFYNDAYIPFTGLKHPKYLGRSAREQWAEIWEMLDPLTKQVLETGQATWAESMMLFMNRKGFLEETYFTFSYGPIRDESGAVGGIINPCQETTEKILSERRLKMLHNLSSLESNTMKDVCNAVIPILEKNPYDIPFSLIYLGNSLQNASGIKVETALAKNILSLKKSNGPERIDGLRAHFAHQLPKLPYEEGPDSAYIFPLTLTGDESSIGFLVLGISPRLRFDELYQEFFGLVEKHIVIHMGSARSLEREKKRVEELAKIDRAKTLFFNNASHELRTPLTLILGPLEDLLLRKKNQIPESFHKEIEVIHRNALRLLKLVNSLLDFSRIESDCMKVNFKATNISKLTTDLANSFRSIIESSGVKFQVDCQIFDEAVYLDQEMWETICLNLISNAFKFTLKGSIEVSLQKVENWIELKIRDSGIGISQENLLKVFERFHRVEGAKGRSYEGSGIGLSLIKELVQLHKGMIEVDSVEGKGSTFTVKIPYKKHQGSQEWEEEKNLDYDSIQTKSNPYILEAKEWNTSPTHTTKNSPPRSLEISQKRILLAEDNSDMRNFLLHLLEKNWEVEAFSDGLLALESAKKNPPDLIITDMMMPNLDGTGLLKQLRSQANTKTIPVIILSAAADESTKIESFVAGADDYLVKPFSAREFLARVQSALALYELREQVIQTESLMQHNKELERTNEELNSFIYIASHDLKGPLRGIYNFSELLVKQYEKVLDKEGLELLTVICQLSKRLGNLLDALTNYARLDNSEMKWETIDLNQLLQEEIETFNATHPQEKNVLHIDGLLPSIKGCKEMVQEIFFNLISNAYKYNEQLQKSIHIGYDQQLRAYYVKDNGIGIKQEAYESIFKIFRRLHKPQEYGGGTGVGLTIVKKMIERHRGKIWIDSVPKQGTCFYFSFEKQ